MRYLRTQEIDPMTTYPILPIQIDPAAIATCEMGLILLRADNPSARMPASALELLTMEFEGWEFSFETGHYTPAEDVAYWPREAFIEAFPKIWNNRPQVPENK